MASAAKPRIERIENFSDAVIAIIITIMVLELKLPEHATERGLWDGLLQPLLPKLIAYVLSFVVISTMWINHRAWLATLREASRALLWANANLLFWMSLIPISTAFLGENPFLPRAVAVYGFVLFATASAFLLLRTVMYQQEREDSDLRRLHLTVVRKSMIGVSLYGLSVPLAFVSVYLSMAIFMLIPAMFVLPDLLPGERVARPARK